MFGWTQEYAVPGYGGFSGTTPVAGTSAQPTGTVNGGGDYLERFLDFGLAALPTVLGAFVQPQQSNATPYSEPGRNAPPQQVVVSGFNPMPILFWGAIAFGAYKLITAK